MHPLVAIGLVFLTGIAWLGTVLTLLVSLAKARQGRIRTPRTVHEPEARTRLDEDVSGGALPGSVPFS